MSDHTALLVRDLREVAKHLDAGFDKACEQAADLIEAQAAQLAERDAEIERANNEADHQAEREAEQRKRAQTAEARHQQVLHTLWLYANMADFPGDPKVAGVLHGYRDAARKTLAAIQPGDGHER